MLAYLRTPLYLYPDGMRVVAGTARGLRLLAPEGRDVRPTTDRVREATFNALFSMGLIEGSVVCDLFGGTGAMGIEALSRGAAHAHIVDSSNRAIGAIEENLETTSLEAQATVHRRDAFAFLQALSPDTDIDLIIVDPPYKFDEWEELFDALPPATLVVESGSEVDPGDEWSIIRSRKYGGSVVMFLEPAVQEPEAASEDPPEHTSEDRG